jgi:hypothetical protein
MSQESIQVNFDNSFAIFCISLQDNQAAAPVDLITAFNCVNSLSQSLASFTKSEKNLHICLTANIATNAVPNCIAIFFIQDHIWLNLLCNLLNDVSPVFV